MRVLYEQCLAMAEPPQCCFAIWPISFDFTYRGVTKIEEKGKDVGIGPIHFEMEASARSGGIKGVSDKSDGRVLT